MNRKHTILSVLTASTLFIGGAAALAGKNSGPAGLPKPIAEMECLVGKWKGDGTMQMGDAKVAVKMSMDCKRTSGGFGVACQTRITGIPGLAVYEETDLFGYDAGANKYHWFAVTNGGETHDHVAALPAGNTVDWLYSGTADGKPFKESVQMVFADDGRGIGFVAETFVGSERASRFEGKLRK